MRTTSDREYFIYVKTENMWIYELYGASRQAHREILNALYSQLRNQLLEQVESEIE